MENILIIVLIAGMTNTVIINDEYLITDLSIGINDQNRLIRVVKRNNGKNISWRKNDDSISYKNELDGLIGNWSAANTEIQYISESLEETEFFGKQAKTYYAHFTQSNPFDSEIESGFFSIIVAPVPGEFSNFNVSKNEMELIVASKKTYVLDSVLQENTFEPIVISNTNFILRKLDSITFIKEIPEEYSDLIIELNRQIELHK